MVCLIIAVIFLRLALHKIMSLIQNIQASLQSATLSRTANPPKSTGQELCTVIENVSGNIFRAEATDGSERLFRYIGNAGLAIGSQISITSPDLAIIAYGDTRAR